LDTNATTLGFDKALHFSLGSVKEVTTYAGLQDSELKRLKELEEENSNKTEVCQFKFSA